jgi:hypothetical protein
MVSDGASYGNLGVDRSEVTAFQRWDYARPEFNLEVAVFPHGYIKNPSDGLKSIVKNRGFVGTRDWAAERSVPLILSIDPWKRVRADMPGLLSGCGGTHEVWRWALEADVRCARRTWSHHRFYRTSAGTLKTGLTISRPISSPGSFQEVALPQASPMLLAKRVDF